MGAADDSIDDLGIEPAPRAAGVPASPSPLGLLAGVLHLGLLVACAALVLLAIELSGVIPDDDSDLEPGGRLFVGLLMVGLGLPLLIGAELVWGTVLGRRMRRVDPAARTTRLVWVSIIGLSILVVGFWGPGSGVVLVVCVAVETVLRMVWVPAISPSQRVSAAVRNLQRRHDLALRSARDRR